MPENGRELMSIKNISFGISKLKFTLIRDSISRYTNVLETGRELMLIKNISLGISFFNLLFPYLIIQVE